jgi:HEAT repeat protein
VSDARIASAPDRAAIVRLRDAAATHRKQHEADLVKERLQWALSQVSDGRLIEPLVAALSNGDWRVRAYAAWALAATGERSAVSALSTAMKDPHFRVRMHAVNGLERGGPSVLPTLIRALHDSHWQVRIGAVDALTSLDDERAVEPLRAIRNDQHPLVREQVAQALGKLER